ncbi:MAG: nucleotidyltransferase family protein [Spirochaetaceae bacterium]|jgi:molybdenum cofactor cytidylyltransferase|nr:nucleotidyltransferase family protein [Spirochaetaceae bacterium]
MSDAADAMPGGSADAVLMASGFSRRFGQDDKLLALFRGKPLARRALETICALGCFREIFFVPADPAVETLAGDLPVRVLRNRHPELGQAESIRLGASASTAEFILFVPCDQPLLDGDTVRRIIAAGKPERIVQPAFQGVPGGPNLFSSRFREELRRLKPGESGKTIKRKYPDLVITVEIPCKEPLIDVDTPETLRALLADTPET